MNYFKENRRDRERFICLKEMNLDVIYKHAPNIIKKSLYAQWCYLLAKNQYLSYKNWLITKLRSSLV
jgi:hypothetical protein